MTTHYDSVRDLVEIVLNTVSEELGVPTEELSIEVESVVTRGILEAHKRGMREQAAHPSERPTKPPAVNPKPLPRARIPTPRPRQYKK